MGVQEKLEEEIKKPKYTDTKQPGSPIETPYMWRDIRNKIHRQDNLTVEDKTSKEPN